MSSKIDQDVISLYTKNNKSTYEIAQELNTYPNKIRRILKKHNISLKSKSDRKKKR